MKGAPVCDHCFRLLTHQACDVCKEIFSADKLVYYDDDRGGLGVCVECFADEKRCQAGLIYFHCVRDSFTHSRLYK